MFLRITYTALIVFFFGLSAKTQDAYTSQYTIPSTVTIELPKRADQPTLFLDYRVQAKNTIFGISQYFGISPYSIKKANPQIDHVGLQPGDMIRIPIPKSNVSLKKSSLTLHYLVDRKDTWYGIAKRQFGYDPELLKRLNADMGPVLHPGKQIIIGYLNLAATSSTSTPPVQLDTLSTSIVPVKTDTIFHAQNWMPTQLSMKRKFDQQAETFPTHRTQGKAIWRGGSSDNAFYVLHPTAHIGSIIEIYNPMHRTKLYAKVIGRIPVKAYPSDVQLVVSAAVARHLGALDPQFFAKTQFIPTQQY